MSRKRYRRRGALAGQIIRGTTHSANRMSWQGCLVLGAVLFAVFYWLIPGWLDSFIANQPTSPLNAALEPIISRRLRIFRFIGVAAALVCVFFAIRNYYTRQRLGRGGKYATGFLARLLARGLD